MKKNTTKEVGFQFTPMPKQLTHLLDVNLRSMLFALIDDSNYFANSQGWFFRSNADLQGDSCLSKNLVIVTIDTLFHYGIVEVSCEGEGKSRKPNGYKVNYDLFKFFEQLDMNTDIRRPQNQLRAINYCGSGYSASYLKDNPSRVYPTLEDGIIVWHERNMPTPPNPNDTIDDTVVSTMTATTDSTINVTKNEHYIDNIETRDNKDNINNRETIDNKETRNNKLVYSNNILEENANVRQKLKDKEAELELVEVTKPLQDIPTENQNESKSQIERNSDSPLYQPLEDDSFGSEDCNIPCEYGSTEEEIHETLIAEYLERSNNQVIPMLVSLAKEHPTTFNYAVQLLKKKNHKLYSENVELYKGIAEKYKVEGLFQLD